MSWGKFDAVKYQEQFFELIDVPGDNSCFYHAIVRNDILKERNPQNLRANTVAKSRQLYLYGTPREKMVMSLIYRNLGNKGDDLLHHLDRQQNSNEWGTTIEMCFISIIYGVNVCSISNTMTGFHLFDTHLCFNKLLRMDDYVVKGTSKIWLYHHALNRPFQVADEKIRLIISAL